METLRNVQNLADILILADVGRLDETAQALRTSASSLAEATLKLVEITKREQAYRLRLKLALHLAPPSAIDYQIDNPTPMWKLIANHLEENLGRSSEDLERLSKEVAATLKSWREGRAAVTTFKDNLLARDGRRCRACFVPFDDPKAESVATQDPYKPYFRVDPSAPMNCAVVDHIEPISAFGTNDLRNLQLLCRLCNHGKGAGDPPVLSAEYRFAATPVESIDWNHRAKLLFFTLAAAGHRCEHCGITEHELTVRPIIATGANVLSNLKSICYSCANRDSSE